MAPSAPPSFSLVARDLVVARGPHVVLAGVDVALGPRTRLGVVGPNGVGKSTLLRALAGLEPPDRGRVQRAPPTLRVAYLAQEPERGEETVRTVLARRVGVATAAAALDDAASGLAGAEPGAEDRYAAALDAYLGAGCADFDARAAVVADTLGLGADHLDVAVGALSGGQAARAGLAAVLLARADVWLLDEPTNDLDFDGLERLERFLGGLAGGVVVVSHDRAFLERTVTSVLELDEHTRTGSEYAGGWQAYLAGRAVTRRHAEDDYARYRTQREQLERRAQRQREWATKGEARVQRDDERDKHIRQFRVASSQRLAAKARATDRALERLDPIEKPWEGWNLRFDVASAGRAGAVVARLHDAVVERGDFRLGPVNLEVRWADRLAVVGPNGAGKSTLLDALLGRRRLRHGERWVGPRVVVGDLEQHRRLERPGPLLDTFQDATRLGATAARAQLAKFGLGASHITRPATTLSPGERTRAVLAEFASRGVNCLVLDEPTNHLDLAAIEELEAALERYDGTLILVTHDRALLDAVRTTRTVRVEGGQIRDEERR